LPTMIEGGRRQIFGDLLFTHRGFSGPAALHLARDLRAGDSLAVNYLPGQAADDLRLMFLQAAAGNARSVQRLLEEKTKLPQRFLHCFSTRAGLDPTRKSSTVTGSMWGALAKQLTHDNFVVREIGNFSVAMATRGGVSLDEIDLHTMESKKIPGLFFAGEVLDVDGDTGGYNLQFAFSSAKAAIGKISL